MEIIRGPTLRILQLGFELEESLLKHFGSNGAVDVHQFIACISVCHSDSVNHPKSKQVRRAVNVFFEDICSLFSNVLTFLRHDCIDIHVDGYA